MHPNILIRRLIKRSLHTLLSCLLGSGLFVSAFASTASMPSPIPPPLVNYLEFDLKQANKEFDQLNLQLSVEDVNLDHLDNAIRVLNHLMEGANNCVGNAQKKLDSLQPIVAETTPVKNDTKNNSADILYLQKEQKQITAQLAQCRLFLIRAQEAVNTYQKTVSQIRQTQTLTRGLPIWVLVNKIFMNTHQTVTAPLPQVVTLPVQFSTVTSTTRILGVSALIAFILITWIKRSKVGRHYFRTKRIGFSNYLLLTLCLLWTGVSLDLHVIKPELINNASILTLELTDYLAYYFWGLAIIVFLFKIKPIAAFLYWYALDGDFFKRLIFFLLSYYTIANAGDLLLQAFNVSDLLRQLGQSLFLLGVLSTAAGFFYYFCKAHPRFPLIQRHNKLLLRATFLVFLICTIINFLGYQALTIHLTYSGITTFAILLSAILIEHATAKVYMVCSQPGKIHQTMVRLFGYKTDQTMTEFIILKMTIQIMTILTALYLIGESWGYGTTVIDSLLSQLMNGIHFSTFTFYPTRIVAGIIVFCLLYLLFRGISTAFSKRTQFEDEEETQVALASILTYIGFACALVAALFISGIDFTGLAIVAGALSVGVGLGLQSIVNNFVSGIILLIEKPIQPGDRIKIDGIEGIVKKIRVRSTQITTAASEDVIIPNSDLITRPVTNFMFSNPHLSIHCEVGVAYDSNTQFIQQLLLQAAHEHDEILKTTRHKPSVLFHAFGDSAMIFQLWFLIKDGNKKSKVQSDINFSIERLFKEHQIKIAYPQRDINIKVPDIKALKDNI